MTRSGSSPILLDIVQEHFEELDFLWEQREGILYATDWNLAELFELEGRAEAHLDALRLAEGHALEVARPALTGDEPFAAAAAALVLMAAGDPALAGEVLDALRGAEAPETRTGLRIGLRHANIEPIRDALLAMAGAMDSVSSSAAADILVFQRVPVSGLEWLMEADEAETRVLAYHALGRQRALDDRDYLRAGMAREDVETRRAALRAGAMSAMPELEKRCRQAATHADAPSIDALWFLGVFGNPDDLHLLETAARDEECASEAIAALGSLGRVAAIPLLIELMGNDGAHAPDAADAFTRITGLEVDRLTAAPSAEDPGDSTDEDATEIEGPARPDAAGAEASWSAHAEHFDPSGRWQCGIEVSEPLPVLDRLQLAARRDVYLCACATGGDAVPDIELEARVWRPAPTDSSPEQD
jgi:uncharacterized protein (TIGR02270 family)